MKEEPKLRTRSLTPAKAGNVYGKFTPSPAKEVIVGKDKVTRLNRKERRHG